MIKRELVKTLALGLCMSALFAGSMNLSTAYAQSIGGVAPTFEGTVNMEDSLLYEKQAEMDQYIFAEHVKDIEAMGFKVIYTGVADKYVEVGITPYSDENAAFLYEKFGKELVKVVDTEEVYLREVSAEAPDVMPLTSDTDVVPVMDMGDTATTGSVVSDTVASDGAGADEALIKEREQIMADDEEKLTIQITSIDLDEPVEDAAPDVIRQIGPASDVSVDDTVEETYEATGIKLVSAQEEMAVTSSAGNVESENKGLPTASIALAVAAGLLIIGTTAYTSAKRKTVKKH